MNTAKSDSVNTIMKLDAFERCVKWNGFYRDGVHLVKCVGTLHDVEKVRKTLNSSMYVQFTKDTEI